MGLISQPIFDLPERKKVHFIPCQMVNIRSRGVQQLGDHTEENAQYWSKVGRCVQSRHIGNGHRLRHPLGVGRKSSVRLRMVAARRIMRGRRHVIKGVALFNSTTPLMS